MQILCLPSSPVSLSMSSRVIGFSLDGAADMFSFEQLTTPTTLWFLNSGITFEFLYKQTKSDDFNTQSKLRKGNLCLRHAVGSDCSDTLHVQNRA